MEDADKDRFRVEDLTAGVDECQEALHTLYHYLDGELTLERRKAIKHHLESCSPCLQAFDWEAELKVMVARCCRDQVPNALRQKIARQISEASESERGNV